MSKFTGSVLALDLATVTGYAFGKPGSSPKFGHHRFAKTGQPRPAAYKQFRLWLDLWCSARKTDLIVFESPAVPTYMMGQTNVGTTKLLFGLCEHLEEWAYNKIELREASVSQVRSHFIGRNLKGAVARPITMARCHERGWKVETSDRS